MDVVLRVAMTVALVTAIMMGPQVDKWFGQGGSSGMLIGILIAWVLMNGVSGRVRQKMQEAGRLMDSDLSGAENALAESLRRWPLQRPMRLILYYRLAVVRHRQQRFEEAAAIAQAVLNCRLPGRAEDMRADLLIMTIEAGLRGGDLPTAWRGLVKMSEMELNLATSLRRLSLQIRYEIAAGHYEVALRDITRRVHMVELMPAAECGAAHARLALAASRMGRVDMADWLHRRAELFCTAEQLAEIDRRW